MADPHISEGVVIRRTIILSAALAALLAAPLAQAQAVTELAGVKYQPSAQIGSTRLQLNGAGIRYKFVKVYTAGLYLTKKVNTTEAVLNASGPRRMHIVMLREIDANELGKLFTRGMEQNTSREEFSKVIPGVIKMSEIFSARKRLLSGDYFSIDYVPGVGSSIVVNGKPASEPIKEPEFFNALMKIWLGRSPADAQLKDALLGTTTSRDPFNN